MLRASNLQKSFGKRSVVRGVSMQVERGNVVGLLGPNGAGKTTCFYMIVGLIAVDEGTIQVDDVDITHQPVNVRSSLGVGYLPQDASIFRKLTVEQNIEAILEIRKGLTAAERRDRLAHVEPIHLTDHLVEHLPAFASVPFGAVCFQLDALDDAGRITASGRSMAALGLHPRLAHLLLRAADLGQDGADEG